MQDSLRGRSFRGFNLVAVALLLLASAAFPRNASSQVPAGTDVAEVCKACHADYVLSGAYAFPNYNANIFYATLKYKFQ